MELRSRVNAGLAKEDKISLFAFVVKAYSLALKDFPKMNSHYYDDKPNECTIHSSHNISIAIDSPSGLVAPNIKDVQKKSIRDVQREILRLRKLAESSKMGRDELFGGTAALSNVGTIGGKYAGPLNLPNQVCIVALGSVTDTPKFVNPVNIDGKNLYEVEMKKIVRKK